MKLSFSTKGWKKLSFDKVAAIAADMHFGGVELYNLHKREDMTGKGRPLHIYSVAASVRALRDAGIGLPCLDTSCDLSRQDCLDALLWTIERAGIMRVPYVSAEVRHEAEDVVRNNIESLLPAARKAKVTLLLKTRGIYANTERLKELLDSFADDALCALWDMHHS